QYFPDMSVAQKQNFLYIFFPFMFGIYPYTVVNEKQKEAMEEADVNYVFMSIYEITYNCVKQLLSMGS
ncbi:MAG: TetR/AcrR family transcriptional regulator, partial [Eubacteriales bacterium]|nr:TetR/AcrR family transcriptional regulator [Eubacteriales bacterium]